MPIWPARSRSVSGRPLFLVRDKKTLFLENCGMKMESFRDNHFSSPNVRFCGPFQFLSAIGMGMTDTSRQSSMCESTPNHVLAEHYFFFFQVTCKERRSTWSRYPPALYPKVRSNTPAPPSTYKSYTRTFHRSSRRTRSAIRFSARRK